MPEILSISVNSIGSGIVNAYLGQHFHQLSAEFKVLDAWLVGATSVAPYTNNAPISSSPRTIAGTTLKNYTDDFYNRIHIRPSYIDLGNMLSTQVREVEVWSAFFNPTSLLNTEIESLDNISISPPINTPLFFAPLQSRVYSVSVGISGSPTVNGTYSFVFDAGEATLTVSGRRVLVWPFIPQTAHRESLEWRTDVIQSFSGEQRLALRSAPRQSFNYTYMLTPHEFSRAKALSVQWAHRTYGVPVWSELTNIGPVSAGATTIPVDTTAADYRAEDVILLWQDSENALAVEITSVQPNSVSLKLPLTRSFTNAYVAPLRFARTYNGVDYTRSKAETVVANVAFSVTENKDLGAAVGYPVYRGKDVVVDRTVIVGDIEERIVRPLDIFDNEAGVVEVDVQDNWVRHNQILTISTKNRAERWKARKWLHSLKGKQKTFWLVSWNKDLEILSPITPTTSGLVVKSINYHVLYGIKDILLKLKNGESIFRRVLSASNNNDGTETLSLDSNLGIYAEPSEVDTVCFMSHVRLDSDSIEISHSYSGQVSISVSVVEVPE